MKVKHETPRDATGHEGDMGQGESRVRLSISKEEPPKKHAGRGRDRDREEPPYFLSAEEDRLRAAVGRRHRGAVVAPYHGLHALVVK